MFLPKDEARGWLFLRFFCALWFYVLDVITSAKEALMYSTQVEMSLEEGSGREEFKGKEMETDSLWPKGRVMRALNCEPYEESK